MAQLKKDYDQLKSAEEQNTKERHSLEAMHATANNRMN